ncbi:MAG: cation:proton antiporter, partial [Verrucomicrobia bacterium]|nr:cation:proton antiporter [Verrucomicrobiota bacterium]
MTSAELSAAFLLQTFVILAICRLVGMLARRLGQPQVVGEMVAGVILGPSLFGLVFPVWQQVIFPKDSLKLLYVLAQFGVGLYMFLVGTEFKTDLFRSRARSAVSVSVAGMVAPFVLGGFLALWLWKVPGLFSEKATQFEAVLFLGAAMSITAFPMLARIIYERGITGSSLGTLALAAGAIDDATAWCVLAVVLASFGGGNLMAIQAIGGGILYGLITLTIGRRLLRKFGEIAEREGHLNPTLLAATLMLLLAGSWITDAIGIHSIFGGFILGIAMPRGFFGQQLRKQLEPLAVVFLLPMFFTFSGLNTRLDTVNSLQLLLIGIVVLVTAVIGKGVACWLAARLQGESNRTALAVGTLMNARGLMELIIVNIGLQKGII